jgi:hypothetical protein
MGLSDRKEAKMRKRELEKLLVQAVADALGVEMSGPRKEAKSAASKATKPAVEHHDHHHRAAA